MSDDLTRQFGAGAVFALDGDALPVVVTGTGYPSLDEALGHYGSGYSGGGDRAECRALLRRVGAWMKETLGEPK